MQPMVEHCFLSPADRRLAARFNWSEASEHYIAQTYPSSPLPTPQTGAYDCVFMKAEAKNRYLHRLGELKAS